MKAKQNDLDASTKVNQGKREQTKVVQDKIKALNTEKKQLQTDINSLGDAMKELETVC